MSFHSLKSLEFWTLTRLPLPAAFLVAIMASCIWNHRQRMRDTDFKYFSHYNTAQHTIYDISFLRIDCIDR